MRVVASASFFLLPKPYPAQRNGVLNGNRVFLNSLDNGVRLRPGLIVAER